MNQPPLNPDAPDSQVSVDQRVEVIETPARDYPSHGAVTISLHHSERQSTTIQIAERTAESLRDQLNDHLAAVLPEVTSVEELDQLPVGAVVYASNHIGPAEKFEVGWMGCGNNAAWSSALLARDGLPARVLYRPEVNDA